MVAGIGLQIPGVAVVWGVYERTTSPVALGLMGLAQTRPVVALACRGPGVGQVRKNDQAFASGVVYDGR